MAKGVRPIADAGLPIVEIGYGLGFIAVARVQFRYSRGLKS
jgi:hypothetical protein